MGFKHLSKVKLNGKARLISGSKNIIEQIENEFGKVTDRTSLKFVPSFLEYVCCLIEEAYTSKSNLDKQKVNKKDEAIKIITEFIKQPLTEQDKKQIIELIDDLHSSRRIKKASYLSSLFFQLLGILLKKLR